jgi:hypothetical protein
MAQAKLDSPLVDQAIDAAIRQASDTIDQRLRSFGDLSGSSLESSASIPVP